METSTKEIPKVSLFKVLKNRAMILDNPLNFHRKLFSESGDIFQVRALRKNTLMITRNPEIIQSVLQKQQKSFEKSKIQTEDTAKYMGKGLLTSTGEVWKAHRKMIQPGFHKKSLEEITTLMFETIQKEINKLPFDQEINIYPVVAKLAYKVVADSLFSGVDVDEKIDELQKITDSNQRMLIKEIRQPFTRWWYQLTGKVDIELQKGQTARNLVRALIEDRIVSKKGYNDLLDMLLNAEYDNGDKMEVEQVLDEVMILFTAGYETTANALSFLFHELAKDAEIQERIRKEAVGAFDEKQSLMEVMGKLPFTRMCVEETLRLHPPAYVIDRVAKEDVEIDGVAIPKNSMVILSIFELHRNEQVWKDPTKFNPSRFEDIDRKIVSRFYYPFGGGPRMCIGNNFAMFEMILTCAYVVKSYQLSTTKSNINYEPLISLKPKQEVPVIFSKC